MYDVRVVCWVKSFFGFSFCFVWEREGGVSRGTRRPCACMCASDELVHSQLCISFERRQKVESATPIVMHPFSLFFFSFPSVVVNRRRGWLVNVTFIMHYRSTITVLWKCYGSEWGLYSLCKTENVKRQGKWHFYDYHITLRSIGEGTFDQIGIYTTKEHGFFWLGKEEKE